MKAITILLTLLLAAPALGDAPGPRSEPNAVQTQQARETVDVSSLQTLFAKMRSASWSQDLDEMRAIVEKIIDDDSIPDMIKGQFLEPYYVEQIRSLANAKDDKGLEDFCDAFLAKASESPDYYVASTVCVELISVCDEKLGAAFCDRILDAIEATKDPKAQKLREVADSLRRARKSPNSLETPLLFKNDSLSERYNAARGGVKEEIDAFLLEYRRQLESSSVNVDDAPTLVSHALDENQTELAEGVARIVEDYQQKAPKDFRRRVALAEVKRALRKRPLESIVGQEWNLVGIDVFFHDFNLAEKYLDSSRKQYVLVAFIPKEYVYIVYNKRSISEFEVFAQSLDRYKVAPVAYVETCRDAIAVPNGAPDPLLQRLRTVLFDAVAQNLAIDSNIAYETKYPAYFQSYRIPGPRIMLVDSNGRVVAVDSSLARAKRRLQIFVLGGVKQSLLKLPQDLEQEEP